MFSYNPSYQNLRPREDLTIRVRQLSDELAQNHDDFDKAITVLEEKWNELIQGCTVGSALVELLKQLGSQPRLALEVFLY